MIPSAFVRVDALPLTNNGKVDRRALPSPDECSFGSRHYEEPQGKAEVMLARVWASLLQLDRISRRDHFFVLGGHSFLAVRMTVQLRQQGYMLSVRVLFENPVLFAMATHLRQGEVEAIEAIAPPNLISLSTKALTPDLLPLIDLTQDDIDLIVHQVPGGVANIQDIYALSPLQNGIVFHHIMATVGDPYLTAVCKAFRDKDSLDRYLDAFQQVVNRHDTLRTAIIWENLSTPAQVVLRQATLSVVQHTLDSAVGPAVDQLMQMYNPQKHRIELCEPPLIRFAYAQDADGKCMAIQLLHHLITDHTTLDLIGEEIEAILDARTENLPVPWPYRNLISQTRLGTNAEEHERFFHKMLHDIDSPSLPFGLSGVHGDGTDIAEFSYTLPQELNTKLRAQAKRLGVSLATLCHLAWALVVSATSGQSRVVFGTVLYGRMQGIKGSDRALGLFINNLPMRVDVEGTSVLDSVRKVHADLAELLDHEHASLAAAQLCSSVPSGTPLFSSILNYRHNSASVLNRRMRLGYELTTVQQRTNYLLGMAVEDYGSSLELLADVVNPYKPSRICAYMEQALHNLAESLERSPDKPIHSLNVLPPEEYEMVVHTWNNTDAPYPSDRCIHQLFEDQVERTSDAVAILHGDRPMTYGELSLSASHLAIRLASVGIRPGDYVAILLDRSFELIIAQLAILKVGAAYVPIDIHAPLERQGYIVKDSGSKLLITDDYSKVPAGLNAPVLTFRSEDASHMQGIGYNDRVTFAANPAFDVSMLDIWAPLLNGATIVIIDKETLLDPHKLAAALGNYQVTMLFLTTALLHQYVYVIGPTLSKLRILMGMGEQGLVEAYTEVSKHEGRASVINVYGPTEASVASTAYQVSGTTDQLHRLPIGRPISNSRVYILDKHLHPVPIGAVGELYIGGPGVANGYLNRPELTEERFLADPFSKVRGAHMYKTGDMVRYLPDGNLVFIGRNDNQVKIRGYRVELGEIEARLAEHPQVREVVVIALGEGTDDKQLVAYVVAVRHEDLAHDLRDHLSVSLPEYMIPSAFVRLDAFPLTNNGKIDRRALPNPDNDSFVTSDYVPPEGELEVALAAIWSELLKVEKVGRHDNFFMLGGHSLLAVRLMNRVSSIGVHMPLSILFSCPTLIALAKAVSSNINQHEPADSPIIPVARDGPLELSLAQQRLWFLAQMDGFSEIYHVPFACRLHGLLDHAALKKTLDKLYARHESLRTIFVTIEGQPRVQLLPADHKLSLTIRDLRGVQDKEVIVKQATEQNVRTPFDLEKGPLVRAQLLQLTDDEHVLLITMHHIITDGWSMGVMIRELNELYEAYATGQPDPLEPPPIQYPDYAAWQRQQLTQARLKDQAAYWRETLAEAPVSIELPTDRPRPSLQSFAGASVPVRLDSQLTAALKTLSQKHGVTMFMTILAAWSAVLSRLSGQDDIVIGTPSANRSHHQVEQLIGFFVSTLALRIDLSDEPSAAQFLERVRKVTIAAQTHQDIPFEQVVEVVQPPRRADLSPIFQVMFAWQNNDTDSLNLPNIEVVSERREYRVAKYEMELSLRELNGEIVGGLNYSTALFDCETTERHVGYLEAMLRWMATDTEESLDRAPILGPYERELLLRTWNATDLPYPDNSLLHQLFENQVEMSPDSIAIVHDEQIFTYRDLNSRANWIAHQLVEAGVTPGDYIMLLLDRSIDLVASQIAVLKTGAAYVPLDPNAPAERQVYVASDCGSTVLITNESTDVPLGIQAAVLRVNAKQSEINHVHANFVGSLEGATTCSKDTVYVMYTSGSTGQPKGVIVHHRGVARLVINNGFAEICPDDRVAFTTNPAFDPSTYQVWAPLLHGASIVVINTDTFLDPDCLAEALARYQVTCMYMTHGILHQYAYVIGSALSNLKYLLGGAEQGLIEAYMAVLQHGGPVRLVNRYGPTETTVSATAYTATTAIDKLERLPIGRPISNTRVYILDRHLAPVPIGVVGELYIGGAGVASGYLNRPELTEERFLPDPFAETQSARMYKTGDMVRYLPDGNLVFIGRNDNQVKIRGYRVELGEIEARLAEHPQVREVVVIALGEGTDDKQLVAYVVAAHHDNLVNMLRDHLSVSLPEYMIPSAFVRMDAFPLTNNGKINRPALPDPGCDSFVTSDYVPPEGELEVAMAAIWMELLK
ncbi:hypothetical protein BGZ68_001525, partial [Mortierella alpina]